MTKFGHIIRDKGTMKNTVMQGKVGGDKNRRRSRRMHEGKIIEWTGMNFARAVIITEDRKGCEEEVYQTLLIILNRGNFAAIMFGLSLTSINHLILGVNKGTIVDFTPILVRSMCVQTQSKDLLKCVFHGKLDFPQRELGLFPNLVLLQVIMEKLNCIFLIECNTVALGYNFAFCQCHALNFFALYTKQWPIIPFSRKSAFKIYLELVVEKWFISDNFAY